MKIIVQTHHERKSMFDPERTVYRSVILDEVNDDQVEIKVGDRATKVDIDDLYDAVKSLKDRCDRERAE